LLSPQLHKSDLGAERGIVMLNERGHGRRDILYGLTEITVYQTMLENVNNAHREVVLKFDVTETAGALGTRLKKQSLMSKCG
jgi:hypothetical protein